MMNRVYTWWCAVLAVLWISLNLPSTSGLGGFFRHAGFPLSFAHGAFGRFEHFDGVALAVDGLLGVVVVFGIPWLCAWSRQRADKPEQGGT